MKIEVKHFADPEETISAIPGKVTVQVTIPEEAGGEDVQGPIDLVLGQQLTLEVTASEFEYPGGGIEGCFPAIRDTTIQAAIDTERLVAPGGLAVNPTYAKALGTAPLTGEELHRRYAGIADNLIPGGWPVSTPTWGHLPAYQRAAWEELARTLTGQDTGMLGNGPLGDVDDDPRDDDEPPRHVSDDIPDAELLYGLRKRLEQGHTLMNDVIRDQRAAEAQHRQIKAAIELAVRELSTPQTNEQRARLRDGLQELLDGNAALAEAKAF